MLSLKHRCLPWPWQEGYEKADIAETIGRPVRFVQTWWRKEPKEVPKPAGAAWHMLLHPCALDGVHVQVHDYLKIEFWRDIEIIRGFGKGQGIYEDALVSTDWVQPMADGREFRNGGGYRLKYDKEGRMRPQGNQNARLPQPVQLNTSEIVEMICNMSHEEGWGPSWSSAEARQADPAGHGGTGY